jgi:hypothetical protein
MGNNPVTTIDPDGMLGIPWGAIISVLGTAIQKQGVSWVQSPRNGSLTPMGGTFGEVVSAIGGGVAFGLSNEILDVGKEKIASEASASVEQKRVLKQNTLGAPQLNSGSIVGPDGQKMTSRKITDEWASKAFENKSVDDPTYGFIKDGKNYEKVFFDQTYDPGGPEKGSYMASNPIELTAGMVLELPLNLEYDATSNITDASLQSI